MGKMVTAGRLLVAILVSSLAMLAGSTLPAHAAEAIADYQVAATIETDGSLQVAASISFDAAAPATFNQTFRDRIRTAEGTEYRYMITDVKAAAAGQELAVTTSRGANGVTVSVATGATTEPIELSYTVTGAALATADSTTTVAWPMLQGLEYPVTNFDAEVAVPALFELIDCAAGDPDSPGACTFYAGGTHDDPIPVFNQADSAPGDVVVVTVRFQTSAVQVNQDVHEIWSLDRAFSAAPLQLGLAAGVLVLGALLVWLAHRKVGRDAAGAVKPTLVAEFHPIGEGQSEFRLLDKVRPGEVGTLADERVDPIDITATLLDLAVRGHLRITELPAESSHAVTEWTFTRTDSSDKVSDYERTLLDAVAPASGEAVKVSNLSGAVGAVIGQVQSELYDEVVSRGWFARRPDTTRNTWARFGWVGLGLAIVVTLALVAFTTFGLLGLALVAVALGVLFVGQEMPARTAAGGGVLIGLDVLRGDLLTHDLATVPADRKTSELSTILPYAVVLGGRERWLQAMADADEDGVADSTDLDWYHGPQDWQLADLPASLSNFITTVQGTLFSR